MLHSMQTAHATNPPLAVGAERHTVVVPPFRFAVVEDGVYRGAYPRGARNTAFLRSLGIRTVISLTPDPLTPAAQSALGPGVHCLHVRVPKPKEDQLPYDAALVLRVLTVLVLDLDRYPVYLHCLDGQSVTGGVVMALRKVQGWTVASAAAEYARCIRGDVVAPELAEFVAKLAGELDFCAPAARGPAALAALVTTDSRAVTASPTPVEPPAAGSEESPAAAPTPIPAPAPTLVALPRWFWGGTLPFRRHPHSGLRLKLPPAVPAPVGPGYPAQTPAATADQLNLPGGTGGAPLGGGSGDLRAGTDAVAPGDLALKDLRTRLLSDILGSGAAGPASGTSSTVGAPASATSAQGFNVGEGLGIGLGLNLGGGVLVQPGGVGGAPTAGAGAAGMPNDHDLDDDLDDELDEAGDEVNLSRMVQALNLEGLSG
ncbi:protein-tyrosine-phosphatase [Blastocladiella emersonii ATCC 22665]|nr:protein-tyrosine-phosphatase [Blastocladiella emersonii ATCC 22665]